MKTRKINTTAKIQELNNILNDIQFYAGFKMTWYNWTKIQENLVKASELISRYNLHKGCILEDVDYNNATLTQIVVNLIK